MVFGLVGVAFERGMDVAVGLDVGVVIGFDLGVEVGFDSSKVVGLLVVVEFSGEVMVVRMAQPDLI